MSVDIKQIAEAIQKATTPEEVETLTKQYDDEIKALEAKASEFDRLDQKGIMKELKEIKEAKALLEKEKKDQEDADAAEAGEFKTLAEKYKAEKEKAEADLIAKENERLEQSKIAEKWTSYEKARRESLLAKITDPKRKKLAEQMTTLETLEQFVELEAPLPMGGSGNRHPQQRNDEPLIKYDKSNMPT